MDVVTRLLESRRKGRERWPRHTNYMSDIGHGCERFLTYARTHWEDREVPSDYLLGIFADGNMHEDALLKQLGEAGFKVLEQQTRFVDDYLKLSGRLDARLVNGKESWLLEIKSMNPFIWAGIDTYEDMLHSRKPWIRHYPAQMQAYLHYDREKNKKESKGLFLLKNKATAELKEIEVEYDADAALELMLKAERINKSVDKVITVTGERLEEHLPDRVDIIEGLCDRCDFRIQCLPDVDFGEGAEVLVDDDLLELLERRETLIEGKKEYDRLDKIAKTSLKGRETVMIGDFISHSKLQDRKGFSVKPSKAWVTKIRKAQTGPSRPDPED